jgi:hypothetical protein
MMIPVGGYVSKRHPSILPPSKTKKRYPKSGLKKVQKRTSEKPNPQEMLEILNEEP